MERIAVLSDIHGNILALEEVVMDIEQRNVDLVVNLGDHLSGPLWPKETIDFLKEQNWLQIRGNHDRQLVNRQVKEHSPSDSYALNCLLREDLEWLHSLQGYAEIEEEIQLFHACPEDDLVYLLETIEHGRARLSTAEEITARLGGRRAPMILCGHSHIPRVVERAAGQLIVNPGSVGLPAYDDTEPEFHVMENGSPHARYAMIQKEAEKWKVELYALPYDHRKAAEQARKNGRMDWELGLRTGFMKI